MRRPPATSMTENEWPACTDPRPILDALHGKASERKFRLFACSRCRRWWASLPRNCRDAVAVAEVDGEAAAQRKELKAIEARLQTAWS
jgi:hypothetical protein